ncbi:MAG: helix-turn-helix domain-containing protein [Streptococcaceae bacterium]|jgi:transcriptional regulator with XRE-family HTH domain|nr:helix-turn-helix domain-containing protein [Streptococcaceae bacterium]
MKKWDDQYNDNIMQSTDFYNVITRLCAQKGISITALGEKLKLSKATTSGWKKGAQPQARTLKTIADYFGVSVDYLLYDSGCTVNGENLGRVVVRNGSERILSDEAADLLLNL